MLTRASPDAPCTNEKARDLHVEQVHRNLRRSLQYRQMFPERGRVQDIGSGVPRRLDDELMRRRGSLAERLRGVGHLSLQSSTFCGQKSDNEAINLSDLCRARALTAISPKCPPLARGCRSANSNGVSRERERERERLGGN